MSAFRTIARGLASIGLPALAWHFRRARRREGRALILMYHRVSGDVDGLGLSVPPALFDMQLELLRRRTHVKPLREVVGILQRYEPLAEDIAAITFDDGYRDNLDTALPILERHRLPATVFVTSGFVDGTVQPLGERLLEAFARVWRLRVSPNAWRAGQSAWDSLVRAGLAKPWSFRVFRRLEVQLKRANPADAERLLKDIERLGGATRSTRSLMLDWEGVRTLAARGVEIGSHAVSHTILACLPPDSAEREIRTSKQRIEAQIGRAVVGFAFPNGQRGDFMEEHVTLLHRCGYAYACTAVRGANRPGVSPFRLRRIGVGVDTQALLDLKLALAERAQPCVV